MTSSVTKSRAVARPYDYPWAIEYAMLQNRMMWVPEEVKLDKDISHWNSSEVISRNERQLLTHLFRFFTQADTDVAEGYYGVYMSFFKNPDIRMMLGAFANMEGIHKVAYAMILEQLGMGDDEFSVFMDYKAMADKHDYLHQFNSDSIYEAMKSLAVYSGGNEGLQLYVSFAILMNMARTSYEVVTKSGKVEQRKKTAKMPGMCNIVIFSFKDESLHVDGMTKLFRTLCAEKPRYFTRKLRGEIQEIFREMVELENKFVDLAFEFGEVEGLEVPDVKKYAQFLADRRLIQLGIEPIFGVKETPFPWIDLMVNGQRHDDFFVGRVTDYNKAPLTGDLSSVFGNRKHIGGS